jgi:hypothetical protein
VITVYGQAREHDTTTGLPTKLGANNMDDLWPNRPVVYQEFYHNRADSITILPTYGVNASLNAPSYYPYDSTFSYVLEVENDGNTYNNGIYGLLRLPREGIHGNEFTPEYEKVYVNRDGMIIEETTDEGCFTDPLGSGISWTEIGEQATTRTGYEEETDRVIDSEARCLRVRHDGESENIRAGDRILIAMDIHILNDVSLENKSIFGRGLGGSSTSFGAGTNLDSVETVTRETTVGNLLEVDGEKGHEYEVDQAQVVRWEITYRNATGSNTGFVTITDTLPDELEYIGLAEPLDTGGLGYGNEEQCTNPPNCYPENTSLDGSGGLLTFTVNNLAPDDGNPGSGHDEGDIKFWARVKEGIASGTIIENCMQVSPDEGGTSGEDCSSIQTADYDVAKEQGDFDPDRGTSEGYQVVKVGDRFEYRLIVINTTPTARYFTLYDEIPRELRYIQGTIQVDGQPVSDGFIINNELLYEHGSIIEPNDEIVLSFGVEVNDTGVAGGIIENYGLIYSCSDRTDIGTCSPALQTNAVEVQYDGYPNRQPNAVDDEAVTTPEEAINIDVLANDTDPDGNIDEDTLSIFDTSVLEHGEAVVEGGEIQYTPTITRSTSGYQGAAYFEEVDRFEYEVCDAEGLCDSAVVQVTIAWIVSEPEEPTPTVTVTPAAEQLPEPVPTGVGTATPTLGETEAGEDEDTDKEENDEGSDKEENDEGSDKEEGEVEGEKTEGRKIYSLPVAGSNVRDVFIMTGILSFVIGMILLFTGFLGKKRRGTTTW